MKEMEDFLQAVKDEKFIKGHEILEDVWREWKNIPASRDESYVLKGLINGTTALALKIMGRDKPSYTVWQTFEKYRPIIHTKNWKNKALYLQAEKILDEKYKKIMK